MNGDEFFNLLKRAYQDAQQRTPRYKVLVDGKVSLHLTNVYIDALLKAHGEGRSLPVPLCTLSEFAAKFGNLQSQVDGKEQDPYRGELYRRVVGSSGRF